MEIWIPVIVAILTSVASFIGAVYKGKTDLKNLRVKHDEEIRGMQEKHKMDMERLSAEIDGQAKLYEQTKQTDLTGEILSSMMKDPGMQKMMTQQVFAEMSKKKR